MAHNDGLNGLRDSLEGFFGGPRRRRAPATRKVAVYPDGTRYTLRKANGAWWWAPGKGSYPQSAAIEHVHEAGGHIEVEPVQRGARS